jgi:predicted Zn-dependent protease
MRAAEGWLDLDEAVQAAEELEKVEFKSHPVVMLLRCRIYLETHRPDYTHTIATRPSKDIPGSPDAWFYLSCSLARLEKQEEARKTLARCFVEASRKNQEQKWRDRAANSRDLEVLNQST